MSETWFKDQIAPDGDAEDGCHPDEAHSLQSYLNGRITTQEAARAITRPLLSADKPAADQTRLWNLLQDALVDLSADSVPRLIDLLHAIEDLPDPDFSSKPTGNASQSSQFTWKGLPNFGHLWSDVHKPHDLAYCLSTTLSSSDSLTQDMGDRQGHRTLFVRRANIEARLAVADIGGIPLDWGYDAIADALERDAAILDIEIPIANEWIAVAGKEAVSGSEGG